MVSCITVQYEQFMRVVSCITVQYELFVVALQCWSNFRWCLVTVPCDVILYKWMSMELS